MILYLSIAAIFLFIAIVLVTVADEDLGILPLLIFLCLIWPITVFVLLAVFIGDSIRRARRK